MRKKICIVADVPNWSFDSIAQKVKKELNFKYDIDIKYFNRRTEAENFYEFVEEVKNYDLVHFLNRRMLLLIETKEFTEKVRKSGKEIINYIKENKNKFSTAIYDHIDLDPIGIQEHKAIYNKYTKMYYTANKKLFNTYKSIKDFKKPDAMIHDICDNEIYIPKNLERFKYQNIKDRTLLIGWVGNSTHSDEGDIDLKGFHTIIKPVINELINEGYNIKGLDINGFNRDGIHFKTKTIVNEFGFNKDGFYCRKDENGEYIVTNEIYNQRGFKLDGTYLETGKKYDKYKFTIDGFNQVTKKNVNLRGFDCNGIFVENNSNYDNNGFKIDGTYLDTGEKYDRDGYNCYGLDKNGLNRDGEEPLELKIVKAVILKKAPMDFQRQSLPMLHGVAAADVRSLKERYSEFIEDKNDIFRIIYNTAFEIDPKILENAVRARNPNRKVPESDIKLNADNYKNSISSLDDILYL